MTEQPLPDKLHMHDESMVSRGARTDAFVNLALLPHSVTVPTVSHDQLRCGTYGPQESIQFEQSLTTSRQSQATQRVVVGGLLSAQREISQP